MSAEPRPTPSQPTERRRSFTHLVERAIALVRARLLFRRCELGGRVGATGHVAVSVDGGTVRVGRHTAFEGGIIPTEIICRPAAVIEIGEGCVFNYGATIEAASSVRIGARTLVASFVVISDSTRERSAPIVIGDDVWIAHGAVIGPGVTVGSGSTVSARSVVSRDVPPNSLVIGNPARAMSLALVTPRPPV